MNEKEMTLANPGEDADFPSLFVNRTAELSSLKRPSVKYTWDQGAQSLGDIRLKGGKYLTC